MLMLERTNFFPAFDGLIVFALKNQMAAALGLAWVLLLALERGEEREEELVLLAQACQ
jgi:hypothetical protein